MGASKRMIASRRVGSVSDARSQTDIFQYYGTVLVSTHSTLVIALT